MKKILLLLFLLPVVFARSYYLSSAIINIDVKDNGLVSVSENLTYEFSGCYSVIYREIPTISSKILSFTSSSDELFYELRENRGDSFYYEFNFNEIQCDKKTNVVLNYDMNKVVDTYEDASGIHFMFWGNEWPRVSRLVANISLPEKIINYWIHNAENKYATNSTNSLVFEKSNVDAGDWVETQIIFERLNNNEYAVLKEGKGLDSISEKEKYYGVISFFIKYVGLAFFLGLFLLFFYVYYNYGREAAVDYFGSIQSDIPTPDSPAVVKAVLSIPYTAGIDAFIATMFDLAKRKCLEIEGNEKKVIIKIVKEAQDLKDYEKTVLLFLKRYSLNNVVEYDSLNTKLKSLTNSTDFVSRLEIFNKQLNESFDEKDYFINEGNKVFLKYSLILLLAFSAINFLVYPYFISPFVSFDLASTNLLTAYIFSIVSFVVLNVINKRVLGKWTAKGRVFEAKWLAFKKYLNDYSLLSKHAPQSLIIWERFLVYAVALGVASNVLKVMSLKAVNLENSNLRGAYYYPAFYSSFKNSLVSSNVRTESSKSSGFGGGRGGFGGGHGGGGGGAR